jgi:hypothetical protein
MHFVELSHSFYGPQPDKFINGRSCQTNKSPFLTNMVLDNAVETLVDK